MEQPPHIRQRHRRAGFFFDLAFLQHHHASNSNLLFATPDTYGLQAAFDPLMPAAVPFTLVIAPNGDVVYQELGLEALVDMGVFLVILFLGLLYGWSQGAFTRQ